VTAAPRDAKASPDDGGESGFSDGRYDSFVIRVLSRPRDGRLVSGQVTHIATRRTLHFRDLQRVVNFMLAQLGRDAAVVDPIEPAVVPDDAGSD
jgi:hypothetical protein